MPFPPLSPYSISAFQVKCCRLPPKCQQIKCRGCGKSPPFITRDFWRWENRLQVNSCLDLAVLGWTVLCSEGNCGVLGWQILASFCYVWIETYPNLTMHPVYSSHHIKCTLFPGQLSTCHFWWFLGNWGFVSKVQSGKEHANFQVVSKHHTLFGRGLKEPLASCPFLRG